jgi:hypothetical protein
MPLCFFDEVGEIPLEVQPKLLRIAVAERDRTICHPLSAFQLERAGGGTELSHDPPCRPMKRRRKNRQGAYLCGAFWPQSIAIKSSKPSRKRVERVGGEMALPHISDSSELPSSRE